MMIRHLSTTGNVTIVLLIFSLDLPSELSILYVNSYIPFSLFPLHSFKVMGPKYYFYVRFIFECNELNGVCMYAEVK